MVITRLRHYPLVCRLCLKLPDPSVDKMVSVNAREDLFHGTIEDYISLITFDASEKSQLFPQMVCHSCLEILRWHAGYQTKVMTISLLMNALAELNHSSNSIPLEDLLRTKGDDMQKVFEELQLNCNRQTCAVDIINVFCHHPNEFTPIILNDLRNDTVNLDEIAFGEKKQYVANHDQSPSDSKNNAGNPKNVEENIDANKIIKDNFNFGNNANTDCEEIQPPPSAPNRDLPQDIKGCPINEDEIALGIEIELADDQNKTLPKKRKPGRPRKEIRTLRCRNCTEVFHDKKSYDHHRWTAHKLFVCEECGQRCASQHGLDNHRARHRNEEEFQCKYCQRLYNVREDLNYHIKQQHVVREKIRCETCGLEFKNKVTFEAHKLTHEDAIDFPCMHCDKKFKARRLLHAHTYSVHKKASHTCDECGKVLRSRFLLLDHIETAHEIQMRFICDICVEVFDDKDQLNVHKSRHRSPSELECDTCLVVFKSKDQMFNHQCITYKKDYVCCGKDHGHHRTYNKHQLVKHGLKVNVRVKPKPKDLAGKLRAKRKRVETCPKCDQVFLSRLTKQRHMTKCDTEDS